MKDRYALSQFLKYSYRANKSFFFLMFFSSLIRMGTTLFNVISLKLLLDTLEKKGWQETLMMVSFIILVQIGIYFLDKLMKRLKEIGQRKTITGLDRQIADKLMKVPYHYLENPYYLDLKERANFANNNMGATYGLFIHFTNIVEYSIAILGLGAVILTFDYLVILVILIALVLNLWIQFSQMKYNVRFYNELIPINRKYGYYLSAIGDTNHAKEMRMYNTSEMMLEKFQNFQDLVSEDFAKMARRMSKVGILQTTINYIQTFFLYLIIAIRSYYRKVGAGTFSLYITSAIQFSTNINQLLEVSLQIKRNIEYIKPYIELMNLEEEKDSGKLKLEDQIEEIEFQNVSFHYPTDETMILKNITFLIRKGEKISIVGLNGAGKTTLIKLLCRLYQPTSGVIKINGIDINEYQYSSYIQKISAVFQDYKLFAYSLRENISCNESQDEKVFHCAKAVGLDQKIESLPEGIDTLYGKEYDEKGIELSGGEAQKIAIARSLYKDASLVILDEPTSALDPLAEADIYQNFNELVEEKTAIYISHRLSSSVFCDKVLIIENGTVIDFDTHHHLMQKKDSLYYQMFKTQAKNYQMKEIV